LAVRRSDEWLPTVREAEAAEVAAIARERPQYNKRHIRQHGDEMDQEFARSLRELRAAANIEQRVAAKASGIGQATLSRAESGAGVLRPEMLLQLLDLYGVTDLAERDRLLELARCKLEERLSARIVLQGSPHHVEPRIRKLRESATLIRACDPFLILDVVQTAEYMAAVFGGGDDPPDPDVAKRVAVRMSRRALLDDPYRQWKLIHTEGALRWQLQGPDVMAGQLDDLVENTKRPNVHLGVIDWRSTAQFTVMNSFHIYDDHTVQIGTRDGTAFLTDPKIVADYIDLFGQIEQLAVYGEEAREVLQGLAEQYRSLRDNS
jgi:transcriptional regulator with XRE-family HTH domain